MKRGHIGFILTNCDFDLQELLMNYLLKVDKMACAPIQGLTLLQNLFQLRQFQSQ